MPRRRNICQGWSVWLDEAAKWRDTKLHQLDRLPEYPPTGGWKVLDAGIPIDLPATTLDIDPEHRGVSWWSRQIDLAEDGDIVLEFGGVRLLCEVFWDRTRIAVDLEGYTPFEVRIPSSMTSPGRHRLDLRVTNPGGVHSWDDVRPVEWGPYQLPSSHDFGGPWLPVALHENAGSRIVDLWVRPNHKLDTALVDVEVSTPTDAELRVEIEDPHGSIIAEASTTAIRKIARFPLSVADAMRYGPCNPHRYLCRVTLGRGWDRLERTFGFRSLDYSDGDLRLNGVPFRMASAISWGWYRRGPVPSCEDVEREAESLTRFGMNTLSAHRFPSTPALQDALEAKGLLLYQEPGGVGGPQFVKPIRDDQRAFVMKLMTRRLRRLAKRDRSRACLIWWNIANEWSADHMASWRAYVQHMPKVLRQQDNSRLTTFTSGWGTSPMWRPFDERTHLAWDYHRVFNWPDAWLDAVEWEVDVARPPEPMLAIDGESACFASIGRLRDIRASLPADTPAGSPAAHFKRWLECIREDLEIADPENKLGGIDGLTTGTASVQAHGVARLIEAHRRQPWLHGMTLNGWHLHHKVGNSGIVAPDRSPIVDPEPIRRANAPVLLSFHRLSRVMVRNKPCSIRVDRIGRGGTERTDVPAELTFMADAENSILTASLPSRITPTKTGLFEIQAKCDDVCVSDRVLVVSEPAVEGIELAIVDPYDELTDWLMQAGVRVRPWRFHQPGPVLVVAERGAAIRGFIHRIPVGRAAVFTGRRPFGYMPSKFEGPGFDALPEYADAVIDMRGAYIGGWAFSTSDSELPNLGAPGVWGAERAVLFAAQGHTRPEGRWLTGFCTFPDADPVDVHMPRLAATTWVEKGDAAQEILYTHLPLVERRDNPLGRAVLLDLVRWLAAN